MSSEPVFADAAPNSPNVTGYDLQHSVAYLRLLDAEEDGADWQEVARLVLGLDPDKAPEQARLCWESHLARARWMRDQGFAQLQRGGPPH
jgi:hypothetical protein